MMEFLEPIMWMPIRMLRSLQRIYIMGNSAFTYVLFLLSFDFGIFFFAARKNKSFQVRHMITLA